MHRLVWAVDVLKPRKQVFLQGGPNIIKRIQKMNDVSHENYIL